MKSIHRFTLIELLAVMALIAILGAIGFGVYSYSKNKAKESATEALLKQLDAGLEGFHGKSGYYPRSSGGGFSPIIVTLASDGTVSSVNFGGETLTRETGSGLTREKRTKNEWLDAFTKSIDLQSVSGNLDSDGAILDGWGNRIYYRSPGQFKPGGYELISAGPDGRFGQSKAETPSGAITNFRENGGDHVCDDIFNF